ncbi:MAG TPA: C4-type zinc ribbon domain-containing protein [Nitrospiria bacterium]|jgi:hypothetical protein
MQLNIGCGANVHAFTELRVLETLRSLIELQEIDSSLHTFNEKITQLPMMIEKAKASYEIASQEAEKVRHLYEETGKKRKDKEIHLEGQEGRLNKLKGRTSEIKTNKEYQTLLSEIETAKQEKSKDEDMLLVLMEQQEGIKQELGEKEKKLLQEKKHFETEKKRLEEEVLQAEKELERLEKERVAFLDQIPGDLKKEYLKIKSLRKNIAVVPIRSGTCAGCNIHILPQMVAELKKQEKVLSCLNCNRILYWKDEK